MSKNNISTVISGFTGFLCVMKKVPKVKYPRTYLQMQYTEVNAKGNMTKITAKKWKLFSLWSQEETVSKLRFFFKFKCLSKVREREKLIFAEKKVLLFYPLYMNTNKCRCWWNALNFCMFFKHVKISNMSRKINGFIFVRRTRDL